MGYRYVPIALQTLVLGEPAPVDLWNEQGILLLARGHVIQTAEHLRRLAAHRPMVRLEDHEVWLRQTTEPHSLLRPNVAQAVSPAATPVMPDHGLSLDAWRAIARQERLDPVELWPRLHRVLGTVLQHPQGGSDFPGVIETLRLALQRLLRQHADDSLFLLLQMLQDRALAYSTGHALLVAAIAQMALDLASDIPLDDALVPAALTMNIAMHELHSTLSQQRMPPDSEQQQRIRAHPTEGARLLRQLGVSCERWLQLVQDHHETPDGNGYPAGKRELSHSQRLLNLLDRFVAGVSPRVDRPSLPPLVALRRLYDSADPDAKALGEMLVRRVGLYPPGSYVRLANGESAVVVQRGPDARQPLVVVLMNAQNIALPVPVLRYTGKSAFTVVAALPPDAVRVRFDPARILRKS